MDKLGREELMAGVRKSEGETVLSDLATCGLGALRISHPAGAFPVTPASLISLRAIGTHRQLLSGIGIDWGSGSGVLGIAAARIQAVSMVYGLEIEAVNVTVARENAHRNGVELKTAFVHADSFTPLDRAARDTLASLKGTIRFILANPPASVGDDGFAFRRLVLRESQAFLIPDGVVFLSISSQYGSQRIKDLAAEAPGFAYRGVLTSTDWTPFDLTRADLLACLQNYAEEERRGGLEYEFVLAGGKDGAVSAQAALAYHQRTQESPFSKWQTHLFARE